MGMESLLGCVRLLLEADDLAVLAELGHPEARGIVHAIEEGATTPGSGLELGGHIRQVIPAQDVVTEDHTEGLVAHEVPHQADGMGDAEGAALVAVAEVEPEVLAIRQQLHDVADAAPTEDDHDLVDAHAREGLEREVDHGLVVDRQQVLVGDQRQRMQARACSAGQDDSLHDADLLRGVRAREP